MQESKSQNKLCHVMETITDFEFRTPDALGLKRDMRQWYYGGRDSREAETLLKRFESLFSGNMALDMVGGLLWSLADESPLDGSLREVMSGIPRGQIVGRSVRAYGITAGIITYPFEKWQADATTRVDSALEAISRNLRDERVWRRKNRMSLPSAMVALAGIAALARGVWFLSLCLWIFLKNRDFYDLMMEFPSSWKWSPGTSLIFLALFTFATGNLLFLLRRMVMTLRAGLLWALYHRSRYMLRRRRLNQLQRAMREEGFGGYCEKLAIAAQQLADLPPDAPQNRDPSRALLGRAGMGRVFRRSSLQPISKGWSCKAFYKKVEGCHVGSRVWIILLCAAVVILRDLMSVGPIAAYLQGLI